MVSLQLPKIKEMARLPTLLFGKKKWYINTRKSRRQRVKMESERKMFTSWTFFAVEERTKKLVGSTDFILSSLFLCSTKQEK
jgi:hypothetical protein